MDRTRPWIGYALVVLSAVSFAANSTAAVVSYGAGASPLSLITFRLIFTLTALYLMLRLTGAEVALPRRERIICLALGALLGLQSWSLFAAIEILPVALGVLTFYLYPIFIGIGAYMTGQDRLSPALIVGLAIAFAGLALALDVTGGGLDSTGIALAALSALAFSVVAVISAPIIQGRRDSRPITLHMHVTATAAFIVIAALSGEFPLPAGAEGWIAFLAVPVFYTIAVTSFFAAVAITGPVRTSLVMNLEPVSSIVFGFLILGQALTPVQLAGAALVIAAVMAVKAEGGKRTQKT